MPVEIGVPSPLLTLTITVGIGVLLWLLFRPKRGLIAIWREHRRLSERVLSEDALKHIHKWILRGETPTLESIGGALEITLNETAALMDQMAQEGFVELSGERIKLTLRGQDAALHIIRAHRLWERYLAEETGYEEQEWHAQADRREHTLSRAAAKDLSAHLGFPSHDPHGDPIPTEGGGPVRQAARHLGELAEGDLGRVVHIEDEPPAVYAQLVAEGIYPGMVVRMIEALPERIRFWAAGNEHVLAPLMTRNISVKPIEPEQEAGTGDSISLADLPLGERAEVKRISGLCRGAERRRLLDLGLIPGTQVLAEMRSPGGDPTAYRVRGALIALRRNQAGQIRVTMAVNSPVGENQL